MQLKLYETLILLLLFEQISVRSLHPPQPQILSCCSQLDCTRLRLLHFLTPSQAGVGVRL